MHSKYTFKHKLILLLILISLIFTGCKKDTKVKQPKENSFKDFTNEIFTKLVTNDGLTLNFTLKTPSNYSIKEFPATFGTVPMSSTDEYYTYADDILKKLSNYTYEKLTTEEQYAYDSIYWYFNNISKAKDYYLYDEYINPTSGAHIQIPILLSEYHFYTKEDVDNYLSLLKDIERYFSDICKFEQMKASNGLFMSNRSAKKVLIQCKKILNAPTSSTFIKEFNNNIEQLDLLSQNEIFEYEKANEQIVLNEVTNAYKKLYSTIYTIAKTNKNTGVLCKLNKGKEYYSLLLCENTGSNRSIKNVISILENTITLNNSKLLHLVAKNSSNNTLTDDIDYGLSNTDEIISNLKEKTQVEFPLIKKDISYTIKNVPSDLQDSVNPAFYIVSQLDNYSENTIYINPASQYGGSSLFTNLAHEAYPGHLYQNAYFCENNTLPIRNIVKNLGYIEGWASYITNLSYSYTNMNKVQAEMSKYNNAIVLCLSARADIGVHYEGWTKAHISKYFTKNNCSLNSNAITALYNIIIDSPGDYLSYAVGYIEITRLMDSAMEEMKDEFNSKDFYTFLLNAGPTPFSSIKSHMTTELVNNK